MRVPSVFSRITSTSTSRQSASSSTSNRTKQSNESREIGLGAFKTTLRVVKEGVDGVPVPGLKAALGALLAVLDGIEVTKRNFEELEGLGSRISELQETILAPLTELGFTKPTSEFESRLQGLIVGLNKVADSLTKLETQGSLRPYFNHNENALAISGLSGRIKELIDSFLLGGTIAQEVKAKQDEMIALIDRLPHAPARYNSAGRSLASSCLEDTRIELLRDIFSWIDSDNSNQPRIFWLNGLAGTGKSTIAQTVAKRCDERGILGASFFFARQDTKRSDPLLVFSTIAYQLAHYNQFFRSSIAHALKANKDPGDATIETQLCDFIITPLSNVSECPRVLVVVIDALDECNDKQGAASAILRWLGKEVRKTPFPLKFLITSRPEHCIQVDFSSPLVRSMAQSFILHDIEKSVVEGDIRRFLQYHLAEIGGCSSWPSEEQLNMLVAKAAGLFIFASTSVEFIRRHGPDAAQDQLKIICSSEDCDDSSPYASLDRLYLQVLQDAIPPEDDQYRFLNSLFQQVVGSIALLLDPLSAPALERLMGLKRGYVLRIIRPLSSVIATPRSDDEVVCAWHQSFPDFLTNKLRCSVDRFFVDAAEQHQRLALHCLDCMSSTLKYDMCDLGDPSKFKSEIEGLQARLDIKISHELAYSCRHWASHVSRTDVSNVLVERIKKFCFSHLLHWLEVLSLLGNLSIGLSALTDVRRWCSGAKSSDQLMTLLDDGQRFLLKFFEPISHSPLHIYHSALPFTPLCTVLSQTFNDNAKSVIKVHGSHVAQTWDRCLRTIETSRKYMVTLSPKGNWIAAGSYDHYAPVVVTVVAADSDLPCSQSEDNYFNVWDAASGACLPTFEGHTSEVTSLAFSPDERHLLSGSLDTTVRIWDVMNAFPRMILQGHKTGVLTVAWFQDGSRVSSGSDDSIFHIWDSSSGDLLLKLEAQSANFGKSRNDSRVHCYPGMDKLVTESCNTCCVWDIESGAILHERQLVDGKQIVAIAVLPGAKSIVMSSIIGTLFEVYVWEPENENQYRLLEESKECIHRLRFSSDGCHVVGAGERSLCIWDLRSCRLAGRAPWPVFDGYCSVFSFADHTDQLLVAWDDALHIWDVTPSVAPIGQTQIQNGDYVVADAVFADGSRCAASSADGTVHVWNTNDNNPRFSWRCHYHRRGPEVSLLDPHTIISPSGKRALTCCHNGQVTSRSGQLTTLNGQASIWDTADGTTLVQWNIQSPAVPLAISYDDSRALTMGANNVVVVWDCATGTAVAETQDISIDHIHKDCIATFSLDGCQVIFDYPDNSQHYVWSLHTNNVSLNELPIRPHRRGLAGCEGWLIAVHGSHLTRVCWLPRECRPRSNISLRGSWQGNVFASVNDLGHIFLINFAGLGLDQISEMYVEK